MIACFHPARALLILRREWPTELHHVIPNNEEIHERTFQFVNGQRIATVSKGLSNIDHMHEMLLHSVVDSPIDALVQFYSAYGSPTSSNRAATQPVIYAVTAGVAGPIHSAQVQLAALLKQDSSLNVLLHSFSTTQNNGADRKSFLAKWGKIALQFIMFDVCCLFSRLELKYANYPCKTFQIANPNLNRAERAEHATKLLDTPHCCRDSGLANRLAESIAPSQEDLLSDDVQLALQVAGKCADVATADVERLNALSRTLCSRSTGRPVGLVRMSSEHLLRQAASEHSARGGDSVALGITSGELQAAEDVATLKDISASRQRSRTTPGNAKIAWINKELKQWKINAIDRGHIANRESYNDKFQELSLLYDSSPEIQSQAGETFATISNLPDAMGTNTVSTKTTPTHQLWQPHALGFDCHEFPLSMDMFKLWLSRIDANSFTAACKSTLDKSSLQRILIPDLHSGPLQNLGIEKMCWQEHPGICRTQDSDIFDVVIHTCNNISMVVDNRLADIASDNQALPLIGLACKFSVTHDSEQQAVEHGIIGRVTLLPKSQVFVICKSELAADGHSSHLVIQNRSDEDPALAIAFSYGLIRSLLRSLPREVRPHRCQVNMMELKVSLASEIFIALAKAFLS